MKSVKLLLLSICLFFSACSVLAPQPTPTATATYTPSPTNTPEPTATFTPEPTGTNTPVPPTETPISISDLLDPKGTPAAEWNGIPIMPEAIAGEGSDSGYKFRVIATPEEVIAYYDYELISLDYAHFAIGESENGTLLSIYHKGAETLTVSAIVQGDGSVIVMIISSAFR